MTPSVQFRVGDRASEALRRLVASRESRDGAGNAVNMAMQYWVSFIMAKQAVASRTGIKERLMQQATGAKVKTPLRRYNKSGTRESTAKRYLQLRDTVAASIVWTKNIENARHMSPENFYSFVGRWIAHRQYSAGYHKAGFRPALDEFRIRRGLIGTAPFYRKTYSSALAARPVSESIMEAVVRNASKGVARNPTGGDAAVLQSEAEVVALLERFTLKNIRERARALGLGAR